MIRRPRLSGRLAVLALVPALAVAVPTTASASHASAAVAATAPASLPATPAGTPFLWGAATSSYQVEGGINCLQPGPGNPWQNLGSPCDDYDFFFGNSNVHYRVNNNTKIAGQAIDIQQAGEADKFWDPAVYKRDFDNARTLGLNSFRISLEWGRIEPQPGVFDESAIAHYKDMLQEMRKRGITPVVTLHHFTLPIWALTPSEANGCFGLCQPVDDTGYLSSLRGWENNPNTGNPDTVDAFVEYVKHVVPELKDVVDIWLTVNEPVLSQVVVGYIAGIWPAGYALDGGRAKAVLRNLILAHVRAYDVIKDCVKFPSSCDDVSADGATAAKVGFAHQMGAVIPAATSVPAQVLLNAVAASNFDYFGNDYFVNAVVNGDEDFGYLNLPTPIQGAIVINHADWANHLDFLGINNYRRFHVFHNVLFGGLGIGFLGGDTKNNLYGESEPHSILNDMGWDLYPQGLYELIMRSKNKWNMPVLITENGLPERADRNRAPFIVAEVREIQQAMKDGATVLGYLHWSLMDNWELQSNYTKESQFGLYHIDSGNMTYQERSTLSLHRELTDGALAYQQIISESRATDPAGAPTEAAINATSRSYGELAAGGEFVAAPERTNGRYWHGSGVNLYLSYLETTGTITGMLALGSGALDWNRVDLMHDQQGLFLRERSFDDAAGVPATRDHRVTYANGVWTSTSPIAWTASRAPGAGLWKWDASSPWGGDYFYIGQREGAYSGKYMTFATTQSGAHATGGSWREFGGVTLGQNLRLRGSDTASSTSFPGLDIFDLTLSLTSSDTASTVAVNTNKAFEATNSDIVLTSDFGHTNYLAKTGDKVWIGQRDATPDSKFEFLEGAKLFRVYPQSASDQYDKEHDPASVMPLVNFTFTRTSPTSASVTFEAGGRAYSLTSGVFVCHEPFEVCNGTWSDIGGKTATRLSEQFPLLADFGGDRTVEANTSGGANVQLDASGSFDIEGAALTFTWSGDFGTASGSKPTVFLGLGPAGKPATHIVCVTVSNGTRTATTCANITVADTTPPTIACGQPDGLWHAADVSIACTSGDIASGLASAADGSFSLTTNVTAGTETASAATGTRAVCDKAGNCATAGPVTGNKVDKKGPAITINQPTAINYVHSATLTLSYAVTDGGSGLNSFTASLDGSTTLAGHGLANGQPISLLTELPLGPHTFKVDAVDNVANTSSLSVTFTIVVSAESIKDDVDHFAGAGQIKNAGLTNSLLSKLNAAAAARAAGNCTAASNIYEAFINELNAQSGKGIDPTAAAIMTADARYLIANCP